MKMFMTALAVASLITAPVAASVRDAAFSSAADRARAENSMFIGMNYAVALDRKTDARPAGASLKVARMVKTSNASFHVGDGLGLTVGAKGRAALLVGGQQIQLEKEQANLSKGATIGFAIVGLLVVGAAVAYFALRDPCDHKECE
jgi:hypothetical protein